jgi:uncharacterized protein (DUF342 family)
MESRINELDNWFILHIPEQLLEADLTLVQIPETNISFETFEAYLKGKGIVHGINFSLVKELINHPKEFLSKKVTVAIGTPPLHGQDGYIKYVYQKETVNKGPKVLEDGTVDYYNIKSLDNIKKDKKIAERIPPTLSISGKNIFGEEIPGKDGKSTHFKIGKNVYSDEAQDNLYAAIDGLVVIADGGKVNVFSIYEVPGDVDFHIGNIDFIGTVVIRGNVLPGFKIKAFGDIRVLGNVEAADLTAGGKIEIGSGIIGHHKCLIHAGTDVHTTYIHSAHVFAEDNVFVTQSIMHSDIKAGKSIVCNSDKGRIIGGQLQAGESLTARNIGNTMSTPTVVEVGILPRLRDDFLRSKQQLNECQQNKQKTEQAIQLLGQMAKSSGSLPPDKMAMYKKCKESLSLLEIKITELQTQISELDERIGQETKGSISVTGTVFGSVKLIIHKRTYYLRDSKSKVKFMIEDDRIIAIPL